MEGCYERAFEGLGSEQTAPMPQQSHAVVDPPVADGISATCSESRRQRITRRVHEAERRRLMSKEQTLVRWKLLHSYDLLRCAEHMFCLTTSTIEAEWLVQRGPRFAQTTAAIAFGGSLVSACGGLRLHGCSACVFHVL